MPSEFYSDYSFLFLEQYYKEAREIKCLYHDEFCDTSIYLALIVKTPHLFKNKTFIGLKSTRSICSKFNQNFRCFSTKAGSPISSSFTLVRDPKGNPYCKDFIE